MTHRNSTALCVFVLTAAFYIYTLLPSVAWGDGIKLQSEVIAGESFYLAEMTPEEFSPDQFIFSKVGVAAWDHPLYIVLGHTLVQTFPFVDPLWLVNLLSAIFGAASVTLVFLLAYRFTESIFASGYAALSLAVSHTFWWHSSTPEVYTLFTFLLLASFYFFDTFEETGKDSSLIASAFFWGLAASTHILAFLVIPALALYYLISGKYRRFYVPGGSELVISAVGFLAGFALHIVQFVRMSASFPLEEILGPVLGSTFLSQLWAFSPLQLGRSLLSYLFFLLVQFGPLGVVLGISGIRNVLRDGDRSIRKVISFFIVFALFGIFYRVTDQFTFFIPSYLFWALLMGVGAENALRWIPGKGRVLLQAILVLFVLAMPFFYNSLPSLAARNRLNDASIEIPEIGVGVRNGLAYYINPNKRGDDQAYDFGNQTISSLAPNSVVIAEWYTDTDEYFIFRYFTKVRPIRADVTVIGWATEDPFSFDSRLALNAIEGAFPERPVYLASLSERFYSASTLVAKYCIIPENNLYRLYPKESSEFSCLGDDAVTE